MATPREALLKKVESLQAEVRELRNLIDALPEWRDDAGEPLFGCPHDGIRFKSEERLAEHVANVHAA
jgi:hypothetical protein